MCLYILLANECGCFGPLYADASVDCPLVMAQLNRINDQESWNDDTVNQVPFTVSEQCLPGWHNTLVVRSYSYCYQWWTDCPSIHAPFAPFQR